MARLAPASSDCAVVMVTSLVTVAVLRCFSAAACSLAGTIVKTTSLPGLVPGDQLGDVGGLLTSVPSTALMTSPACSLPSAGLP